MLRIEYDINGVSVRVGLFGAYCGEQSSQRREAHVLLVADGRVGSVAGQISGVVSALNSFMMTEEGSGLVPVFKRVFLSDPANQAPAVEDALYGISGALSLIGQPPLECGVKVAMLVIMASDVKPVVTDCGSVKVKRGNYEDLWMTGIAVPETDSYVATLSVLQSLSMRLSDGGVTLRDDCLRTWFYVRDIDNRYQGMVRGRNEVFSHCGLSADTHFIASTGIEGVNAVSSAVVTLDAFATKGLQRCQVRYLKALTHLNPTAEYGVAFERATAVDYGDRRHIIVSGTASIDNRGQIVALGDIEAQCRRMVENVAALLAEGDATVGDIAHVILYLRDMADRDAAMAIMGELLPGVACVAVRAAVCRPGWLVEMECMAITPLSDSRYEAY